jgi:hypothetical protein
MKQEMTSIHDNQTWSSIGFLSNHKPIAMKWVYKLKIGPFDTPSKA